MSREFDIVIFGITGYTGKYALKHLLLTKKREGLKLNVAVAGRNFEKCKQSVDYTLNVLLENEKDIPSADEIPIIVADVKDEKSILEMVKRCQVILDLVGPYIEFGEVVIKACLEARTHFLDLSGEIPWVEKMQLLYHHEAKSKGVYIISATGYDSIPVEIGINVLKNENDIELNSVDCFMKSRYGKEGYKVNTGTWNSLLLAVANIMETTSTRKKAKTEIFNDAKFEFEYPTSQRVLPFKPEHEKTNYAAPFFEADRAVVKRSQLMSYMETKERPVQFQQYLVLPNLFAAYVLFLGLLTVAILAFFSWTRSLLHRFPRVITFGFIDPNGPTKEQAASTTFNMLLIGKGWKGKKSVGTKRTTPPEDKVYCRVRGGDPGYNATSVCMVQAGLTIFYESEKMPYNGGVLTPGFAFRNTAIVDRLNRNGVTFTVTKDL